MILRAINTTTSVWMHDHWGWPKDLRQLPFARPQLRLKGRLFGLRRDEANIHFQDLKAGNLICLEFEAVAIIGRLKPAFRSRFDQLKSSYRQLDYHEYMEVIEKIDFLPGCRIKIAGRVYQGSSFVLSYISPGYGRFEDRGQRDPKVKKMTFGLSDFKFELSLAKDNPVTRAAQAGHLLMRGGPLADAIEFFETEKQELLFSLPV